MSAGFRSYLLWSYGGLSAVINHFILVAETGTFILTGNDSDLLATRILNADVGSYTFTGNDADLYLDRVVSAETGSFLLTGNDASLLATKILQADVGSFIFTGNIANLQYAPVRNIIEYELNIKELESLEFNIQNNFITSKSIAELFSNSVYVGQLITQLNIRE